MFNSPCIHIYIFVSPLATLAFELCVVGEKRVENRVGEVHLPGECTVVQVFCSISRKCLSVINHFYSCAYQLYSLHREIIRILRRPLGRRCLFTRQKLPWRQCEPNILITAERSKKYCNEASCEMQFFLEALISIEISSKARDGMRRHRAK